MKEEVDGGRNPSSSGVFRSPRIIFSCLSRRGETLVCEVYEMMLRSDREPVLLFEVQCPISCEKSKSQVERLAKCYGTPLQAISGLESSSVCALVA